MMSRKLPDEGTIWSHYNNNMYEVMGVANIVSFDTDKYPAMVVYKNIANDTLWTRKYIDWYRSMSYVANSKEQALRP
jgi:hypothetical protein